MEFCSGHNTFNLTAGSTLSSTRANVKPRQENGATLHHKSLLTGWLNGNSLDLNLNYLLDFKVTKIVVRKHISHILFLPFSHYVNY